MVNSLVNKITTIVKLTPTSQSNNSNCGDDLSLWPIIGAGFLLFTNVITIIVLIIISLLFLRYMRKHKKL